LCYIIQSVANIERRIFTAEGLDVKTEKLRDRAVNTPLL
jgi:hypothetical protein